MTRNERIRRPYNFKRGRALFVLMVLIWGVFLARLYYLQVIKYDYYTTRATQSHEKKYILPAERGAIYAYDRETISPIVLNENLPTIYADPRTIDNPTETAVELAQIIGGNAQDYVKLIDKDSAYVVIRKQVSTKLANKVEAAKKEGKIKGIGVQDAYYRAYPEKLLASQVLGFVNVDNIGQYGIEKYFNDNLAGIPGRVQAVTDARGVPLRGEANNIIDEPVNGRDHVLTIDINIQKRVEELLKAKAKQFRAKNVSAIVMDPNSGAIKAMANYPTFNPAKYNEVEDYSLFQNNTVSSAYEAGSVIKLLTMSAGLNEGVVKANSTYYDKSWVQVDDRKISNAVTTYPQTRTMRDVIRSSLNTGAVHVLSELGGGSINEKGRKLLYNYFSSIFRLGKLTGIELPSENKGVIQKPDEGYGLNVKYANMTFGQGVSNTMIQVASAISAIVNGGDYYKPYIIDRVYNSSGEANITDPVVVRNNILKESVANEIKYMMRLVVNEGGGQTAKKTGYKIGGKTGTAQLLDDDGEYSDTRFVGSFVGYIEGADGVEYVIMTRIDEPQGVTYAASGAAAPLFAEIAHWLIDYERIPPIES